jgi:hypothetical protein
MQQLQFNSDSRYCQSAELGKYAAADNVCQFPFAAEVDSKSFT